MIALSFDDVLLKPGLCPVKSRKEVDTSTDLQGIHLDIPIIAANMPSVCENTMASALCFSGGLGIIHRMMPITTQAEMIAASLVSQVGAAIGVGPAALDRAKACVGAGATLLCLDVAHGHQFSVAYTAYSIRNAFPYIPLIIGNLATKESAEYFCNKLSKDQLSNVIFKVGVGGGSVCTTRIRTGCGMPTLESVREIRAVCDVPIIADGGIKNSGDIVKALAFGADAVMLGSLLAGTKESPGEVIKDMSGQLVKVFRGAASFGAKKEYFGDAENVEGAEKLVPYKGKVEKVLTSLMDGVRSGFTYCGSANMKDLQRNTNWVQISAAGYNESLPHGLFQ